MNTMLEEPLMTIRTQKVFVSENVSIYRNEMHDPRLEVLTVSTPQTREILNTPEILGISFQNLLSEALQNILTALYELGEKTKISSSMRSTSAFDVLYILRGGLNFDFHRHLFSLTKRHPEVTFLSSQRVMETETESFSIEEQTYQKWNMQENALLCIGDISATGTTLKHALNRVILHSKQHNLQPRRLFFVTVGTIEALQAIQEYQQELQHAWGAQFEGITILFLEQIFSLYTSTSLLYTTNSLLKAIHLPFTDFFRMSYPNTFEFEAESVANPICFLERCAIYDGGSRAFEPAMYMHNIYSYWKHLKEYSSSLTVEDVLQLKSNFLDYDLDYDHWLKKRAWLKEDRAERELKSLYENGHKALQVLCAEKLSVLCERRINILRAEAGL